MSEFPNARALVGHWLHTLEGDERDRLLDQLAETLEAFDDMRQAVAGLMYRSGIAGTPALTTALSSLAVAYAMDDSLPVGRADSPPDLVHQLLVIAGQPTTTEVRYGALVALALDVATEWVHDLDASMFAAALPDTPENAREGG